MDRTPGPALGVGICLSGGGLRAAAYALGVLQVLHERRGLLLGPTRAGLLSAVSGGSYVAATVVSNARAITRGLAPAEPGPMARGSPEEQHVLDHGRYLVEPLPRRLLAFVGLSLLNIVVVLALFGFVGLLVACVAVAAQAAGWQVLDGLPWWVSATAGALALVVIVHGLFAASATRRATEVLLGFGGLLAFIDPLLSDLTEDPRLGTAGGWWPVLAVPAGVALAASLGAGMLALLGRYGWPAALANGTQTVAGRAAMLAPTGAAAVWWYDLVLPAIEGESNAGSALLAIFGFLLMSLLLGRASLRWTLHGMYRDLLRSCFGAVRTGDGTAAVPATDLTLSELDPSRRSFPYLVVNATGNARHRDSTGRIRRFAPVAFTPGSCGPLWGPGWVTTPQLEYGHVPEGSERPPPLLTLFSAIAATGAAVSPSMGRYTVPSARTVLAIANLRLGLWLPNLLDRRRRAEVEAIDRTQQRLSPARIGDAYDHLVPELLGIGNAEMYVSDGGHYDNLGLLSLLRARCAEIWCVDSSPDRRGTCAELSRVLQLAGHELGIEHDLDLTAFATGRGRRPAYPRTLVSGTVRYPGGGIGRLHVVKLGLPAAAPPALQRYRREHRRFPHHPTWWQWYPRHRMEAYRDLGRWSAQRALDDLEDRAGPARADVPPGP